MLGDVIGRVFSSILPVQAELILLDVAAHPVKMYVKGFGALPANVASEDAVGGRAIGFDQGGRLWVAHLYEGCADGDGLLALEENCSSFGFHGGIHDSADGLTFGEYWSIRDWSGTDMGWWLIVA